MVSCCICQNCTCSQCRPPFLTKILKSRRPRTRAVFMSQFWKHSSIYTNVGLAYFMHLQRTLLYVSILSYAIIFSWQSCTLQYRLCKLPLPSSAAIPISDFYKPKFHNFFFHTYWSPLFVILLELSYFFDWLRPGQSGDRIPVGGEIFRTCPDRPWGPPSLLHNRYRIFPEGKERPGRDADPSPPSSAVVMKVELYLYSPYGTYGLCRASVPVQGCTFTFSENRLSYEG